MALNKLGRHNSDGMGTQGKGLGKFQHLPGSACRNAQVFITEHEDAHGVSMAAQLPAILSSD